MKNYFISGIGTDVGKTLASAVLTEALQADYWKPIQSGYVDGKDSDTVKSLISNPNSQIHSEIYLLKEASSPHIAAKEENINIDKKKIQLPKTSNKIIIEGAGGILVPINEKDHVIDLVNQLDASVILVISSYLGCINHSLLSIDYLLHNKYKIAGLILNGNFDEDVRSTIINYKNIPVLAEIPFVKNPDKHFVLEQATHLNVYLF